MGRFGQTLFGGSGFIRWVLSPFVLLFAVTMPLLIEEWTVVRALMMVGLELMCICLLAGFWLPSSVGFWAFRLLAGLVSLSYMVYLVEEMFFSGKKLSVGGRPSDASPVNAVLGFLIIGLPGLWFALKGRFTFKAEASPAELAAERRLYEERIVRPDWEFYERHLERPAPRALRELYADQALVTSVGLACGKVGGIGTFSPLCEEWQLDTRDLLGTDIVPFAISDCGDPIYLRPGATEPDKVYIAYHDDPGNVQLFAASVAEMLGGLRNENRHH